MIKILSSADWHVNLHRKKIPTAWQTNRFQMLFDKLLQLESSCDVHVIAGDLFDKEPDPDEICLVLSYLNSVSIPTIIVSGNHEATARGRTFWEHFKLENTIKNNLVHIFTENDRIVIKNQGFCAFPYSSVQTNKLPNYVDDDILVTHIRGEVPPHITAEYDFERLRPWKLVLLGDLHFRHRYKDYTVYYPGSPLNTTFDRDDKREYGVDIITLHSIDDYSVDFVNLNLPKLIRRTVTVGTELTADSYHHVIYEVTGSIDELAKIKKTDMLDKKMVEKPTADATLDLKDKSLYEELEIYLRYIKVAESDSVLAEFKKLGIQ
jgi:DNA repair exonuclease SbcCD nuclease subunit